MKDFRNLDVWVKAHALTLRLYQRSGAFPREEIYGLTSQIRRAAASIGANIAEGCGRGTDADFARFLQQAMGSAAELEYHLLLSRDLGFVDVQEHRELEDGVVEVKRMLASLIGRVRADVNGSREHG